MKLLRYGPIGEERAGLLDADGAIRALPEALGDLGGARLTPAGLAEIAALDPAALPVVPGNPRIGACIARPGKFVCIGLNYSDHAAETGAQPPAEPIVFGKWTSAVVGPDDDVIIPRGSEKTDWEVELGVVIGSAARHVDAADALAHVVGYCVVHDVSERAFQLERGGMWDKGKGCDSFGPIGPWLVTTDDIPDPQALRLWLEVDGHRYQDGTTANMIFTVAELVAYVSGFCTLEPGDIIATGTPAGVGLGQKPPVFLRPGQTVRLGIDGLGAQTQRTVAAA
ncbi:MAG: fumarylacetoacetate hydrolase family protein [Sphingomonas sp.]|uniref:fumarylacetoacetate hydrolase family protein n=1 Tax=Sphingomonas sp. TaxID=28214 RepID=UPI001AD16A00|nr:fumarylacetoacetate hydrolase family protein [Sphingomonas sp.]MBN8806820.1 fumarylacetoacetate hydrolase family protein [Sphingomonas sp.]